MWTFCSVSQIDSCFLDLPRGGVRVRGSNTDRKPGAARPASVAPRASNPSVSRRRSGVGGNFPLRARGSPGENDSGLGRARDARPSGPGPALRTRRLQGVAGDVGAHPSLPRAGTRRRGAGPGVGRRAWASSSRSWASRADRRLWPSPRPAHAP